MTIWSSVGQSNHELDHNLQRVQEIQYQNQNNRQQLQRPQNPNRAVVGIAAMSQRSTISQLQAAIPNLLRSQPSEPQGSAT